MRKKVNRSSTNICLQEHTAKNMNPLSFKFMCKIHLHFVYIYKTGKGLRFILPRTTCCTINQNNTLVEDL